MTIDELKAKIDSYREFLRKSAGKGGPASMGLVDALFTVVEQQQREINELKEICKGVG